MTHAGATVLREPRSAGVLLWTVAPAAGAGLLWLAQYAAAWVADLPAAPLQAAFDIVARIPQPWASFGAVLAGLLAGAVFAAYARHDSLTVVVSPAELTLTRAGQVRRLPRRQISAAFLDGKELVVLGPAAEELDRRVYDLEREQLAAAMSAHGYPWRGSGDPFADRYWRWVPDLPDMPAGADAVFAARQRAIDRGDKAESAQLRSELARLGLVLRDEGNRQFWRRHEPPPA